MKPNLVGATPRKTTPEVRIASVLSNLGLPHDPDSVARALARLAAEGIHPSHAHIRRIRACLETP